MRLTRTSRGLVAALILAVCAGCGGGGGGTSVSPPSTGGNAGGGNVAPTPAPTAGATTAPSGNAKVPLTVRIPKTTGTASGNRSRAYIDPGAASMVLTLLSTSGSGGVGGTQGPFNLTASSPNCVAGQTGLVCTFSITAPVGSDVFLATTYKTTDGTGTPLGSGAVALAVALNATNAANLALTGPISSVQAFATNPYLGTQPSSTRRAPQTANNTVNSTRVFLIALDAAGNQIINPTLYDVPLTLTLHNSGLPMNAVALSVAYAGLPGEPTAPASTGTDGGTVMVYAPSDAVTFALGTVAGSGYPYVTISYTPQAGPNAGVLQQVTSSFYITTPPPIVATAALAVSSSVTALTPGTAQYFTYTVQAYDSSNNPLTAQQRIEDAQGNLGYVTLNLTAGYASFYPYIYYGLGAVSAYYDGTGLVPITVTPTFGTISGAPLTVAINPALVWSSADGRFAWNPSGNPSVPTLQFPTNTDPAATLTLTAISHTYAGTITLTTVGAACNSQLTATPAFGTPSSAGSPFTVTLQPYTSPSGMTCTITATENSPPSLTSTLNVYVNNVGVTAQGKGSH